MAARNLKIFVTADSRGAIRATGRASTGFGNLAKSAIAAGAAMGAAGFVVGAKKSIEAASDLNEQINKVRVVFRGSEKDVLRWSKNTASALGISQRAALEAAGVFGNMLVPMGFARKEAGNMSTRLVKLAADMASFNNASPEDTLIALRAGLAGESEPLRKFGVFLNDARLKQEALNLHLKNAIGPTGTLTTSAKAQATYSLILKDSADAQGDFHRTSKSVANQQRILSAEVENLAAKLGTALLPIVAKVLQKLTKFVNQMQTGKGAGGDFADAVSDIAAAAQDVGKFIGPPLKAIGEFALKHPKVAAMAVAVAALAKGMSGLRTGGGKLGGVGQVLGTLKPIPVFVTNPGFGGGKGPVPGGGKVPPVVGGLGRTALRATGVGAVALGAFEAQHALSVHRRQDSLDELKVHQQVERARIAGIRRSIGAEKGYADEVGHSTKAVSEAYERTGAIQTRVLSKSGRKLSDLRMLTAQETQRIKTRFSEDTDKGRQALARNYRRAAEVARSQMESTGKVTQTGLAFIRRMMAAELRLYGLSKESIKFRLEGREQSGKTIGAPLVGKQFGGTVPGQGSGDRVLMQAMVEPGEDVFVLNRRASAERRALETWNGMIPRFQLGGLHSGIKNLVQSTLGRFPGLSVTSTTGGGHAPGSYHYRGMAADLASGSSQYMNQAAAWIRRRFGRSLTEGIHNPNLSVKYGRPVSPGFWGAGTWAGHRNHIHLAVAGALRAMGMGPAAIRRLMVRGRGPLKALAQAGLDRVRGAANRRLSALTAFSPDAAFTGSVGGYGKGRLQNLWTSAGGDPGISNLMAAIALAESGGNPRAHNPSGASGLWQILGQIVPGNIYNPLVNARNAVAKYRSQGLGAWAVYTSGAYRQFLSRGGLVRGRRVRRQRGGMVGLRTGGSVRRHHRQAKRPTRRHRIDPRGRTSLSRSEVRAAFMDAYEEQLATREALAALTPEFDDDLAIAEDAARAWQGYLDLAQAEGDQPAITRAATSLKTARDTIAQIRGDQQEDLIRVQEELKQQMKELKESIDAQTKYFSSVEGVASRTAIKAMSDVISGQISGYAGQRARSAGDGVTGARY